MESVTRAEARKMYRRDSKNWAQEDLSLGARDWGVGLRRGNSVLRNILPTYSTALKNREMNQ